MSFLSSILAFIITALSFIPFFPFEWDPTGGGNVYDGGGSPIGFFLTEEQASEAYRNGSWNGSKSGLYEVRDGLLYVGNRMSNYPADSSLYFYRPVITSVKGKYTVFEYDPDGVGGVYNLCWDYRGERLYCMRFSDFLKYSVNQRTELSADGTTIILYAEYPGQRKTLYIPVDYEAALNKTTTTVT